MNSEKIRILQQVQDGKIDATEALALLNGSWKSGDHVIRVKVQNSQTGTVETTVPISLLKTASRFGALSAGFIPVDVRKALDKNGINLSSAGIKDLIAMIDEGAVHGKIAVIDIDKPPEGATHVEIFVD